MPVYTPGFTGLKLFDVFIFYHKTITMPYVTKRHCLCFLSCGFLKVWRLAMVITTLFSTTSASILRGYIAKNYKSFALYSRT